MERMSSLMTNKATVIQRVSILLQDTYPTELQISEGLTCGVFHEREEVI